MKLKNIIKNENRRLNILIIVLVLAALWVLSGQQGGFVDGGLYCKPTCDTTK